MNTILVLVCLLGLAPVINAASCAVIRCGWGANCVTDSTGNGSCRCPDVCTALADPVCGSDGNTYGNPCLLSIRTCQTQGNVTQAHTGACEDTAPASCAAVLCITGTTCTEVNGRAVCCKNGCTKEYQPRCGSDGVTYGNKCLMEQATCRSGGEITQAYLGVCQNVTVEPTLPVACQPLRCGWGSHCEVVNGTARCVCPTICDEIYQPVCGSDGVTYANECKMGVKYCKTQGQVSKFYDGECQCAAGVRPSNCLVDPCQHSTCPRWPTARCQANYCGGCFADYYDQQSHKVDCVLRGNDCPRGTSAVNCLIDPCRNKQCSTDPDARCVSNYCGGCNWVFVKNGYIVDCGDNSTSTQACSVRDWTLHYNQWPVNGNKKYYVVFGVSVNGSPSLKAVINYDGSNLTERFLRESVAAYLNAYNRYNFGYNTTQVINRVQYAYNNNNRMSSAYDDFKNANNQGSCPL